MAQNTKPTAMIISITMFTEGACAALISKLHSTSNLFFTFASKSLKVYASNSILFGTPLLKARKDTIY